MHTAIDVGVNHLNSNRYRKLPKEVKDDILNSCIIEFALKAANDVGSSTLTPNTRDEVKATAANLRPLYTGVDLPKLPNSSFSNTFYTAFELPTYYSGVITSGYIRHQTKYYIVDKGGTDWGSVFDETVNNGDTLVANLAPMDSTSADIDVVEGLLYRVNQKGDFDWTTIGYSDTTVREGVIIKPTADVTITSGSNVILQPLLAEVEWDASTLRVVDNFNMLVHQSVNVFVSTRDINKGTVYPGTYIVTARDAEDDLSSVGGSLTTQVGDIIICSSTVDVNFRYGSTIARLNNVPCIIATEELVNSLNLNSDYTNSTSPLAVISNGELKVYHAAQFTVYSASLVYIRVPRNVSFEYNISCDLSEYSHANIINMAIARALSYLRGDNYQAVKAEQQVEQKTHRI